MYIFENMLEFMFFRSISRCIFFWKLGCSSYRLDDESFSFCHSFCGDVCDRYLRIWNQKKNSLFGLWIFCRMNDRFCLCCLSFCRILNRITYHSDFDCCFSRDDLKKCIFWSLRCSSCALNHGLFCIYQIKRKRNDVFFIIFSLFFHFSCVSNHLDAWVGMFLCDFFLFQES